eukprot:7352298-Prymnesium_polylepis.2
MTVRRQTKPSVRCSEYSSLGPPMMSACSARSRSSSLTSLFGVYSPEIARLRCCRIVLADAPRLLMRAISSRTRGMRLRASSATIC